MLPQENDTNVAKLLGSLHFDLSPVEANAKQLATLTNQMGTTAEKLQTQMRNINLLNDKDLATHERLLKMKSQEALTQQRIATARLRESQAAKISMQAEAQRALTQERYAKAGQAALRTEQMQADVQNRILAAENKKLQLTTQRQALLERQRAMELGMLGAGSTGGSGSGNTIIAGGTGSGGSNRGSIGGQVENRMMWLGSGMMFFGSGAVFANIVNQMGSVEMGMTEIARIQDDITFNTNEMCQAIIDLGKEYGQQWSAVQDIALRWSQAGLNVRDTIEATRASLLALNTAELDAQQSTTDLIGIMAQWDLKATDLQGLIDKINITADNFVVTSQDLVDGLLRSSETARVFGMSIEETIAVLTAMQEASGRTGREVGNAFNSIMSFMQRNTALSTFKEMGINVWADETETQFKNLIEIFDQVAANWGNIGDEIKDGFVQAANEAGLFSEEMAAVVGAQEEWNDMQKRDVSQAMAGVYRRNYLLALIQNWATVQKVLNGLVDAQGYSLRENERTMEAYQKRVEALKMAVTELCVAISDAGLLDIMKDLVDGTREGIETFRELPQPVQEAIIALVGLSAALIGVNLSMKVFMGISIGSILTSLAAKIAGVEAATLSLSQAFGILVKNPIVQLIAALGFLAAATAAYGKYQAETVQRISNSIKTHQDAAQAAKEEADKIQELTQKYNELQGQSEKTAAQEEELKRVEEELVDLLPSLKTGYDEAGNAVYNLGNLNEEAAGKVKVLTNEMKEQLRIAAKVAGTQLSTLEEERAKAAEKKARADKALDELNKGGWQGFQYGLSELYNLDDSFFNLHPFATPESVSKELGQILQDASEAYDATDKTYKNAKEAIDTWEAVEAGKPINTGGSSVGKGGTATTAKVSQVNSGSASVSPASATSSTRGISISNDPLAFLAEYENQLRNLELAEKAAPCNEALICQRCRPRRKGKGVA